MNLVATLTHSHHLRAADAALAAWITRAVPQARTEAALAAALAAAESGARVIVCDEQASFGGSLRFATGATIDGQEGWTWAENAVARLEAMDKVFKSSDATRDAAVMHRIVQRLQAEYGGDASGSEKAEKEMVEA